MPADWLKASPFNYRIIIRQGQDYWTYPNGHEGDPGAWDYLAGGAYQTLITPPNNRLNLFESHADRAQLLVYNPNYRRNTVEFVPGENSDQLLLKAGIANPRADGPMGFQFYFGDKLSGRKAELPQCTTLVVRGKSAQAEPVTVKISLIQDDGAVFSTVVSLPRQMTEVAGPLVAPL